MKLTHPLITCLLLLAATQAAWADSAIEQIRQEYKEVRTTLPTLNKTELEPIWGSSEGGEMIVYRDSNNRIRLIQNELYGEMGRSSEEYYYKDNQVFFVLRVLQRYNRPMYLRDIPPQQLKELGIEDVEFRITKQEDRFYFQDGKMLKWLDTDKKSIPPANKDYIKLQIEVRESSKELLKAAGNGS